MTPDPRLRRASRRAQPPADPSAARGSAAATATATDRSRRVAITVDRITDAALEIVAADGYDALTMRSVAARLDTGPASLYAHVVNKSDLDELIIGRLCDRVTLPQADPTRWREQITDVCKQLRDLYLQYPGISRAALAMDVTDLEVLRLNEGMLGILIDGGVQAQSAAWAIDALFLYIGAYTLELSVVGSAGRRHGDRDDDRDDDDDRRRGRAHRDELVRRFEALPPDRFPHISAHAAELTAGDAHERFDFTIAMMIGSLGAA